MKLLVDENLSARPATDLEDLFPGSVHVSDVGLGSTGEAIVWHYAREHSFTFLTKDKDFANLGVARGAPPKIILLQTGNCSKAGIERIIRNNAVRLSDLETDPKRSVLIVR